MPPFTWPAEVVDPAANVAYEECEEEAPSKEQRYRGGRDDMKEGVGPFAGHGVHQCRPGVSSQAGREGERRKNERKGRKRGERGRKNERKGRKSGKGFRRQKEVRKQWEEIGEGRRVGDRRGKRGGDMRGKEGREKGGEKTMERGEGWRNKSTSCTYVLAQSCVHLCTKPYCHNIVFARVLKVGTHTT